MANVEIPSYKRLTKPVEKESKKEINVPKIGIDEIAVGILSFLMSRVVIINSVSPFGVAFFSSGYNRRKSIFSFIGVCLGVLTIRQDVQALKYIAAMILFTVLKLAVKKDNVYQNAVLSGAALFISGFVFSLFDYMLTYDLLMLGLESFVCAFFVMAFNSATEYINKQKFFSYVSNEQLLSLTFVIALSLSGLGKTVNIGYFNLCEILCSVVIMLLALNRGGAVGACAGVVAGVVCALGEESIMNTVGVYALCGFVGGCVRNTGKPGVCAGFLLSGACAGFLSSASFINGANLLNMILGGALFLALPKKWFEKVKMFTDGICIEPDEIAYMKKAREYISGRLGGLMRSYERLSEAVAVDKENEFSGSDTHKKAANHAALKVCARCGMKNICWEKQKSATSEMLNNISNKVDESGYADIGDFPREFRNKCVNFTEFAYFINHYYSMSRINELWQKQIIGSRSVISEQYKEFSDILNKLRVEFSGELSGEMIYEGKLEAKIFNRLCKEGLDCVSICVREVNRGYFDAEIKFADDDYIGHENEIVQIVSEVLDADMNIVSAACREEENTIVLEPVYRFFPMCSSASVRKSKKEENGDSIVKENLPDSRFFMAVSDGMGSGAEASVQSRKTNEMLRELLYARYSAMQAVRLVNSALASGGKEVFTTVDMAVIDLMTGSAEFIKIGAMPSLIVSEDKTEAVFSPNLPIGILDDVNAATISKKLKKDDIIIMFSDGLCNLKRGIDWIGDIARELKDKKTDEICEVILKEAIIRNHGKVDDDMSIIVFKIKENL